MPNITDMTFDCILALPEDTAVTMAYIPFQTNASMYDEDYALTRGTLFPNLDKPFLRGSEQCD